MDGAATERKIPVGLIIAGELLFVVAGLRIVGVGRVAELMAFVGVATVVGVALMLGAAFVTATLFKVSFGDLNAAVLKLAGIYLISNGIGALLSGTGLGGLVATAIFFSLMMWLFELEMTYVVVFAVMNWVVQLVVGIAIAGMLR
jgi:hypothetical protein